MDLGDGDGNGILSSLLIDGLGDWEIRGFCFLRIKLLGE